MKIKNYLSLAISVTVFSIYAQSNTKLPILQNIKGQKCKWSTKNKLGAQNLIDNDLGLEFLKQHYPKLPKVKVAVIDSGFDYEARKYFSHPIFFVDPRSDSDEIDTPLQHYSENNKRLPHDLKRDENGHGTATASLIGSSSGIGTAANSQIYVYKTMKAGKSGFSEMDILRATKDACDKGIKIINWSLGGAADESGTDSIENNQYKELFGQYLLPYLKSKGCTIVKSSGNDAFKDRDTTTYYLEDSLLRVSSTNRILDDSSFSTPGEVSAIGSYVLTRLSSTMSARNKKIYLSEGFCEGEEFTTISGTSFSAPQVSGILANIEGMIQSKRNAINLSPQQMVEMKNRIVKASEVLGLVNAYKAYYLTDVWLKRGARFVSIKTLNQYMDYANYSQCKSVGPQCSQIKNADKKSKCVDDKRRQIALCPIQDTAVLDLVNISMQEQNFERFTQLMQIVKKQKLHMSSDQQREVKQFFNKNLGSTLILAYERLSAYKLYQALFDESSFSAEKTLMGFDFNRTIANKKEIKSYEIKFLINLSKEGLINPQMLIKVVARETDGKNQALLPILLLRHSKKSMPNRFEVIEKSLEKLRKYEYQELNKNLLDAHAYKGTVFAELWMNEYNQKYKSKEQYVNTQLFEYISLSFVELEKLSNSDVEYLNSKLNLTSLNGVDFNGLFKIVKGKKVSKEQEQSWFELILKNMSGTALISVFGDDYFNDLSVDQKLEYINLIIFENNNLKSLNFFSFLEKIDSLDLTEKEFSELFEKIYQKAKSDMESNIDSTKWKLLDSYILNRLSDSKLTRARRSLLLKYSKLMKD